MCLTRQFNSRFTIDYNFLQYLHNIWLHHIIVCMQYMNGGAEYAANADE